MSNAEKFIQDCTRNCSNEILRNGDESFTNIPRSKGEYHPWLTPDQTRKAVEIAREEMIEKACKWLEDNAIEYWGTEAVDNGMMIIDFKEAMKDE